MNGKSTVIIHIATSTPKLVLNVAS